MGSKSIFTQREGRANTYLQHQPIGFQCCTQVMHCLSKLLTIVTDSMSIYTSLAGRLYILKQFYPINLVFAHAFGALDFVIYLDSYPGLALSFCEQCPCRRQAMFFGRCLLITLVTLMRGYSKINLTNSPSKCPVWVGADVRPDASWPQLYEQMIQHNIWQPAPRQV